MSEQAQKENPTKRFSLSGAWRKEGGNGVFFVGKANRLEAIASLQGMDTDEIQVFVSPVEVKKSDSSPDLRVSIAEKIPYVEG